jgi:GT2 family glycosyltransferase
LPSVVAVVVTHDPGDWFDETLAGLAAQDYPNLQVLVVDTGSRDDPTERVTAVLPEAEVHRVGRDVGFGSAANEVLSRGPRGDFFLFCHDDVVPEPDAVSALVGTALDCGVAIVGPKLVSWDDPKRLLQVGIAVDRTGVSMPMVEREELDQGQHDGVREVFEVPGAFTLVRADLFGRIGGFDEAISFLADDLSLCWRARIAGARVAITAAARVRHRESLGHRLSPKLRRRLLARHRMRVVLTSYGRRHALRIVPQMALASVAEAGVSLVALRPARVRVVVGAWGWNLRRTPSVLLARAQVKGFRQVDDRAVRSLQVPGLVGPRRLVQKAGAGVGARGRSLRDRLETWCGGWTRGSVLILLMLAGVLAMGSRHLLIHGVPAIGEFATVDPPRDLLAEWLSGWRRSGLGSETAAPTAFGVIGGLGTLLGASHIGLVRAVLTVGLLPLGVLGAARLLRQHRSGWTSVASALAYAAVPVPYTALAEGRWAPLAVYAAAPWLLGALAQASRTAPFSAPAPVTSVLVLGLTTAVLAVVVPAAPVLLLFLGATLALGSVVALDLRSARRIAVMALGGAIVAALLQLPWTLDVARSWRSSGGWLAVGGSAPTGDVDLGSLAALGAWLPDRSTPMSWGVLAAAAATLLVGRSWRLAWAIRAWVTAVCAWGVAALASSGAVNLPLPSSDVMLVFAGAGLALAAGLLAATIELDITGRSRRLGFRRDLVALGVVGLAAGIVPVAQASLEGAWDMPRHGFSDALAVVGESENSGSARVLWLGNADAIPVPGWTMAAPAAATDDASVGYALTEGLPKLHDMWPDPADESTRRIAHAVELATTQQTAHLGRLLAPLAVDYVAVPQRRAPSPFTDRVQAPPAGLVDALAGQLDLERIDVDPAVLLFRNLSALPERAGFTDPELLDATSSSGILRIGQDWPDASPLLQQSDGYARWTGRISPGTTVYQAAAASDRWVLDVDGRPAERRSAFGWANAFAVPEGGRAVLHYETPARRYLVLAAQAGLWVLAIGLVVMSRRRRARVAEPALVTVVDSAPSPTPTDVRSVTCLPRPGAADRSQNDEPPLCGPPAPVTSPTPKRIRATSRRRRRAGREVQPEVVESVTLIVAGQRSEDAEVRS